MAKIMDATDPIAVEHPIVMLYGQPGILKTSLAMTAKDPITLDFDMGAQRAIRRGKILRIPTWKEVEDLKRPDLAGRSTVIIDTVGRMLDRLTVQIGEDDPKAMTAGSLNQKGWGVLKNRVRAKFNEWQEWGLDIILVAHDKEDKKGDARIVRPDIQGGTFAEVLKMADFVGYIQMIGRKRMLDFSPSEEQIGKNPARWEPITIPGIAEMDGFMERLMVLGRDALNAIESDNRSAQNVQQEWRQKLEGFTDAAQFQAAIPEIKKLEAPNDAVVAQMSVVVAKAKGITFDGKTKTFLPPASATTTAATSTTNTEPAGKTPTVDDWRALILGFTTVEQFNAHIPEVKKLGAAGIGPAVSKILIDTAESRGFVFDTTTKQFNAPRTVSVFD